jgi:hypothetical protein
MAASVERVLGDIRMSSNDSIRRGPTRGRLMAVGGIEIAEIELRQLCKIRDRDLEDLDVGRRQLLQDINLLDAVNVHEPPVRHMDLCLE